MNHGLEVSESVLIQASRKRVWAVLTTPALIAEYLFGTETLTDWQPGHPIVFQGSAGEFKYRDHGEILENVPLERLTYSYWSGFSGLPDAVQNRARITYTVEARGADTRFTWTQRGFPSEERHQHARTGMRDFLAQLKAIAERPA